MGWQIPLTTVKPPQEHPPCPLSNTAHVGGTRPPRTCPRVMFNPLTETVGLAEAEAGPGRYVRTGAGLGQADTVPRSGKQWFCMMSPIFPAGWLSCCCQLSMYRLVSTDEAGPSTRRCSVDKLILRILKVLTSIKYWLYIINSIATSFNMDY